MPNQVGLVGFFGWGNFGDELFFQQWTNRPNWHSFRVNDLTAKPYFSRPAIDVAADADALVIGGGDLIRTEAISPLYWNRAWIDRPLVISGIGVAEESGVQRADVVPRLRQFFQAANILSLSARDVRSQRWIESNLQPTLPVRLVPDLAFGIEAPAVQQRNSDDGAHVPIIGLVFNKHYCESDMRLAEDLRAAHLAGKINLRILVLATGQQLATERALLLDLNFRVPFEVFDSVDQMVRGIAGLDLLYSAKFHGLVVAARHGIPSISLRTTSKAISLAESCDLVRLPRDHSWSLQDVLQLIDDSAAGGAGVADWVSAAQAELQHVQGVVAHAVDGKGG